MQQFRRPKAKGENKVTKKDEKRVRQIFLDFVEGRMPTEMFWELYKSDVAIRNVLIYDKKRPWGVDKFDSERGLFVRLNKPFDSLNELNPDNLLEKMDIKKLQHRYGLFIIVKRYLIPRKIQTKDCNADENEYLFLGEMLPEWVEVDDVSFLQDVFSSAPAEMNKKEKLAWCKERIKQLFKYEKNPPDWIQPPEWPIINGIPLVFERQETAPEGYEEYHFFDPETKQYTIIEQWE